MKKSILITASILFIAILGDCDLAEGNGMLRISSEPAAAEIYIDGKRKGNTPAKKGQTYTIQLPEGEYSLEIIKPISNPGKYDQHYGQKTVFVADDSLQTVTLSLKKRQSKTHKEQMEEEQRRKAVARTEEKRRKAAAKAEEKRQKAAAKAKALAGVKQAIQADMITIPSGIFRMGSGKNVERPIHSVQINSFKMSKYEVTQAQWMVVMGDNPSRFKSGMNNPVEQVSWDDIQGFLGKLNQRSGKTFRLPTEAEWEYAARARSTGEYSWGDYVGKNRANCSGCGSQWDNKKTAPVGSFQPNAFGLYDMHGNVWEWVQDCWNYSYDGAPSNGSAWLRLSGRCNARVSRGGSWHGLLDYLRSAYRIMTGTGRGDSRGGFRLVQD